MNAAVEEAQREHVQALVRHQNASLRDHRVALVAVPRIGDQNAAQGIPRRLDMIDIDDQSRRSHH